MKNLLETFCTLFCKDLYQFENMDFYYYPKTDGMEEQVFIYLESDSPFNKPFKSKELLEMFLFSIGAKKQ